MLPRILLFQVNGKIESGLAAALKWRDVNAYAVDDLNAAVRQLEATAVDLVLVIFGLDNSVSLVEICRKLRRATDTPLLLFAAAATDDLAVQALNEGADLACVGQRSANYIAAQVDACLRRFEVGHESRRPTLGLDSYVTADGRVQINLADRSVRLEGSLLPFTKTEFRLLCFLLQHADHTVSYDQILHHVWSWDIENRGNVHTYVQSIRRKLHDNVETPRYIVNEFGIGYRFCLL